MNFKEKKTHTHKIERGKKVKKIKSVIQVDVEVDKTPKREKETKS